MKHPAPQQNSPRYASIGDAARYLAVHEDTIRRMMARGELTRYEWGKSTDRRKAMIRVDLTELDALMRGGNA